jgi:hypothetical protein
MGSGCAGARNKVLPHAILRLPVRNALALTVAIGLGLRLYLCLTSYCMSGDGVGYLKMAREFAAGDRHQALAGLFSPLYPALIALIHPIIPNWELGADLISVTLGTAAIVTVFGLTHAIFGRRDYALGAAALTAFHPDLAAYAASVRTEAGYLFLTTGAVWLVVSGLKRQRIGQLAMGGLIGGIAYLYRTEAIGLLAFIVAFIPLGAVLWRRWKISWGFVGAAVFGLGFMAIASPYMLFLHALTGRWSLGREFTAAMILGMGNSAPKTASWRNLGFSAVQSPFAPVLTDPRLYLLNSARHFAESCYGFVQALGIVLTVLMVIGLWVRRDDLIANFSESLAALIVLFYVAGFSLSYTGARFMSHLIPYTFGWVMAGIEAASVAAAAITARIRRWEIPQGTLATLIVVGMLPQTLWPVGYDQRGLRYAGEAIRNNGAATAVVAARDGRVAYYGGAQFVMLPEGPMPDLCSWLSNHHAGYLLLTDRDENQMPLYDANGCLRPIRRYPRYGDLYYDLFAVVSSH